MPDATLPPIIDRSEEIKNAVAKEIRRRRWSESFDTRIAHSLVWISILTSFAASIIVANGKIPPEYSIFVAVIAGIPGLIVAIDKSFNFPKRAVWGTFFRLDLEALSNEIDHNRYDSYQIGKMFNEVKKRNELAYSKVGFFARDGATEEKNIEKPQEGVSDLSSKTGELKKE